jgi:hypothetical protein
LAGVPGYDRSACGGDGVTLRAEREAQISFIDTHQRLTGFDLLTDIHETFHNLAGDTKAEIALDSRPYGAGEAPFRSAHRLGHH